MCRIVALVAAVISAWSCNASYPTAPADPVAVALQLQVPRALGAAIVGTTYGFVAYTLRSDGAWENVTMNAEWRSSNVGVLRGGTNGSFVATSPGTASVLARYGGFTQSINVVVFAAGPQGRPRLAINVASEPRGIGATGNLTLTLFATSGANTSVTADAAWQSSDPGVVTVDRGVVTALAPGTATITASYQGFSDAVVLSVAPLR